MFRNSKEPGKYGIPAEGLRPEQVRKDIDNYSVKQKKIQSDVRSALALQTASPSEQWKGVFRIDSLEIQLIRQIRTPRV